MAEIILELSGKSGLADNFFGDADTITPQPNIRLGQPGEMIQGLFNPYLRNGYMAPTTTTNIDLTLDVPAESQFGSVELDHINEDIYWADRVKSIYIGDSLTDTSLVQMETLTFGTGIFREFLGLHDLQIYQVNDVPKLFYSGVGTLRPEFVTISDFPEVEIATITTNADSATCGVYLNPSGLTIPTIIGHKRDFVSGSSTTHTVSVTVPSGTDRVLTVITFNSTGDSTPTATYNGSAMSLISSEVSTSGAGSVTVFQTIAPTAGTYNVVVTYPLSSANRLLYAITTDNTNQTNYGSSYCSLPYQKILFANKEVISPNQLSIFAAYADFTITNVSRNTTELYSSLNNFGSDLLVYESGSGLYLQIGYADIPFSLIPQSKASWNMKLATGYEMEILRPGVDNVFLRTADNGFMYAFAQNRVHKIDGTITGGPNGTLTRNVLLFPEYFTITDALDYRSNLYIVIHQYNVSTADTSIKTFTGKCGIYVWNRISTQISSADFIELPGVREIKKIFASPDGQLRIIVISDNGLTELRQFGYNDSGGVVFPTLKTLGIGAYPQFPDGLTTAGDKVIWLANDGKIYCNKGQTVTQLYQSKAPGTTTATLESNITSGAIFYGNGDETGSTGYRSNKQAITYSYLDGATHNIEKIYPFDLKTGTNGAQTPHQGDVYTGIQYIPVTSVLRKIRVYNAPITGSGTDVIATVKLYFNQSSTVGMTKSISKDEAKRGYVDFSINKPYIHAVQLEVEWATSTPLGEDMYLPSVAIISHDPTTTSSPDSE